MGRHCYLQWYLLIDEMFRSEVVVQRHNKSSGDVLSGIAPSWQIVGYLIGGSMVAMVVFFALASYARIEMVSGSSRRPLAYRSFFLFEAG